MMKSIKRLISFVLTLILMLTCVPATVTRAATDLPTDVFLTQTGKSTCTLCSAAMMIRARFWLSGSSDWSMITESGIRSTAWIEGTGLRFKFTYTINDNSVKVGHVSTSGITVSELKAVLDEHPEGIVLYCGKLPHAVFLTDYEGDTFYCAETLPSYSEKRLKLEDSYPGIKYGSQDAVLKKVTAYWYVSSYSIDGSGSGEAECSCSDSYAGNYVCSTSTTPLTIRSGHGTSYSSIGSIPSGATVYVSKASGSSSNDWAHVSYNGITGYASMKYLKPVESGSKAEPAIECWLSDTENGEEMDGFIVGSRYYLCTRLYDSVTGRDLDDVSSANYSLELKYYAPDGSLVYERKGDSDRLNTLGYFTMPGTYTVEFTVTGDYQLTKTVKFDIEDNPLVLHASESDVNLILGHSESTVIYVWTSGYSENSLILRKSSSNDNISTDWGEWSDDDLVPITVTANSEGSSVITFVVLDAFTEEVLDSVTVDVKVSKMTYSVTYDANGGSGAPEAQVKTEGQTLKLSSEIPVRKGYTFLGWAKTANASKAEYQPGDSYKTDANVTLYALWEKDPVVVCGIEIAQLPEKTKYLVGESLDISGLTVRVLYSDDTEALLTDGFTLSGFDPMNAANQSVLVSYGAFTTSFNVTVREEAELQLSTGMTKCGETVCVSVELVNNPGITRLELALSYDTQLVELVCVESAAGELTVSGNTVLVWTAGEAYATDGVLLVLTFRVGENAPTGRYEIGAEVTSATDGDMDAVDFSCKAGAVRVTNGDLLGDVNGDGWVDSDDATMILKYDVGLVEEMELDLSVADVNGDGWVDSDDATMILKYDVGLIEGF